MTSKERFEGCILAGAIGDAFGSSYENQSTLEEENIFYPFGKPQVDKPKWQITDDTQLTLITCEAIYLNMGAVVPSFLAKCFLNGFKERKISGIGSSTLKAFQELEVGGHWSQVGRMGEYAAGNGAAMRIAPLAFIDCITRETIKDVSVITHRNDEAYVGSLAVVFTIQSILKGIWNGKENILQIIIDQLPDTRVRDRLIELNNMNEASIVEAGHLGSSGYVVDSVPLAIFAACKAILLDMT